MEWLNLHTSTLDDERLATAEDASIGTWIRLMRYCIGQENNGRIRGAKEWPPRKWLMVCRVDIGVIQAQADLWQWDENDLVVWGYPKEKQKEVQAKREGGRIGGTRSAQARLKLSSSSASNNGSNSAATEGERKEKEKGKDKGKGKEVEGSRGARAKPTPRPSSIAEVELFFEAAGETKDMARAFFAHFEAAEPPWPYGSWKKTAANWIKRQPKFDREKKSVLTPAEFDSTKPDAHTGGLKFA